VNLNSTQALACLQPPPGFQKIYQTVWGSRLVTGMEPLQTVPSSAMLSLITQSGYHGEHRPVELTV
jgi:hypothetical protein